MRVSRIIVILAAIAVIAVFFLPYVSSTQEEKQFIEIQKNIKPLESVDMSLADFKDVSLFEFAKVYYGGGEELFGDATFGFVYTAIFCSVVFFAVLVLLSALINKPILAIIFSVLAGGMTYLINWDIRDRGGSPQDGMKWGIGYYLLYAIVVIMFICSIWMFVDKRKEKKRQKTG